jgi:uncharacterized protein YutE (UPF0331/DUF86 family)
MVKPEVVGKKLMRATAWLDSAEKILSRPPEEFLANTERRDVASFYLFLAIQECIDLAVHWVADEGWGPPDDAGATFFILADHQAIDRDLARRLRDATGLRNRIAHGYATVDHELIQSEHEDGIAALRRFLTAVAAEAGL